MDASTSALRAKTNVTPYGQAEFDWDQYATARPHYPREIFDAIYTFHSQGRNTWNSVLDVGCGPGNGPTSVLARRFETVTCYDPSSAQLDIARALFADRCHTSFVRGSAQVLSEIEDASQDMVTCFTALHWIDAPPFLREAARVLKPGGTLAAGSYHPIGSSGHPEIDAILRAHETKSLDRALPLDEEGPRTVAHMFREAARSHYDNFAVPESLFTHEMRWYCNLQEDVYYTQYSPCDAVDRRNVNGVGYEQVDIPLPSMNSVYTREEFVELCDTLDHYDKQDNRATASQIWDILGPCAKLSMTRPAVMILCRRI